MTNQPEPLTVIIPGGNCWRTFKHRPHVYGPNDDARRCDGSPLVIDTQPPQPPEE